MPQIFTHPAGYKCHIAVHQYDVGGSVALVAIAAETNADLEYFKGETIAVLTTNIPEAPIPPGTIVVKDWDEGTGVPAALEAAKIASATGQRVQSGYGSYAVLTLNPTALAEYCLNPSALPSTA